MTPSYINLNESGDSPAGSIQIDLTAREIVAFLREKASARLRGYFVVILRSTSVQTLSFFIRPGVRSEGGVYWRQSVNLCLFFKRRPSR